MANAFPLTPALADAYRALFAASPIRPERAAETARLARRLAEPARAGRYAAVGARLGVPWQVVGILHCMESGGDFGRHLHNGDPLTGRTVGVPKGRPVAGRPPFAWEDSAADALALAGLGDWNDWSLAGMAYVFERYNGFGYRRRVPPVPSPYLWSFTTAYVSGKYVADHVWSDTAVSRQCGAMALLRALAEAGQVTLDAPGVAGPSQGPQPAASLPPSGPASLYILATACQQLPV
jgi:lysozyme family protein